METQGSCRTLLGPLHRLPSGVHLGAPQVATHMHLAAVTPGHQIQCAELAHDDDDDHITCHWL